MKRLFLMVMIFLLAVYSLESQTASRTNVERYDIKKKEAEKEEKAKEVEAYLKERAAAMEKEKKKRKPESALRRFEIQFLSARAMAYVSSWLLSRIFAQVTLQESSDLPNVYWYFIIANSAGMAGPSPRPCAEGELPLRLDDGGTGAESPSSRLAPSRPSAVWRRPVSSASSPWPRISCMTM